MTLWFIGVVLDVHGHVSKGLDRDAADTLEPPWSGSDVDAVWTRLQNGATQNEV